MHFNVRQLLPKNKPVMPGGNVNYIPYMGIVLVQ